DPIDPADPFACLPAGAVIGTSSVRRQAQLLHARPDLRVTTIRGNVQTRLGKLAAGECTASLLALAGLKRLEMEDKASVVLDAEAMVPAAGQGIVGITVRESDEELRELLSAIEDPDAKAVSTAERALLGELDGSCRTPIGGHARLLPTGDLHLTGLVARADGTFVLKRALHGPVADAARILPLQRAGQHDAGRQFGLQVLQAVHREIHAPIGQRLVDFLGEQALAADLGQLAVLHGVAGGADRMLLEHVHAAQDGAEAGQELQEEPGLPKRERGAAGADAQRQAAGMRGHPGGTGGRTGGRRGGR
ncbi:MAG: hydroxymethylbilane synthase, partial [Rhodospirillales bacterium]|nr:hydroxymethylbilane synthase [Rhodospirillales bacterium]